VIDMTSISALIDFLMSLMGDDKTKRAFTENPHGTMADNGLHNVSAQDVRDARLIMADSGSARPRNDGEHQSRGYHDGGLSSNDPVREIVHTTNTFEIDQSRHTDVNQNIFNIDNHRTTILDSFNSADTVTAIQDNDTTVDVDVDDDEEENKDTTDTDKDTDDKTDETDDERLAADRDDDGGEAPDDRDTDQDHAPEAVDPEKPASEEPSEAEEPPADDADPGLDPGDGTDPFPTEPEPEPVQDDAPVIFHADDELAVG
jgi:hypothetical protein